MTVNEFFFFAFTFLSFSSGLDILSFHFRSVYGIMLTQHRVKFSLMHFTCFKVRLIIYKAY